MNSITITQATADSLVSSYETTGPAFVLLARGDIRITGQLYAHPSAGSGAVLPGCLGGRGLILSNCYYSSSGGGGGGFATNGAKGGDVPNNLEPGGSAGIASGNEKLVPLRGGCGGGGVNDGGGPYADLDGGGGGAIQLVSRTKIVVDGIISVAGGGGGGDRYEQTSGAILTGGGAGGGILLEAPVVVLGVNARLDATGGDGISACGLSGVNCSAAGVGAKPGVAATAGVDIDCLANGQPTASGSGGGGLGHIRINTRDGTYSKANTAVEDGSLTAGTHATR